MGGPSVPVMELEKVDYILDLYSEASDRLELFRGTGDHQALSAAASALCNGLGRVQEDAEFWGALSKVLEVSEPQRIDALERLRDVEGFLAVEFDILTRLKDEPFAARLLGDIAGAIDHIQAWPDPAGVEVLRMRVTGLRDLACAAQGSPDPEPEERRGWLAKGIRAVAKGVKFVSGAAMCAGDLATIHGVVHVVPSVVKGVRVMGSTLDREG
jgi:hypothetical protein